MEIINMHREVKGETLEQSLLRWNRVNDIAKALGCEVKSWERFCAEYNVSQAILEAGKEATDEH